MTDIKIVDARGLSCPQPVVLTLEAISKQPNGTVCVLVDSCTAKENVSRLAGKNGWAVVIEEQPDGSCRIVLNK